jgi:hypothetical protein
MSFDKSTHLVPIAIQVKEIEGTEERTQEEFEFHQEHTS